MITRTVCVLNKTQSHSRDEQALIVCSCANSCAADTAAAVAGAAAAAAAPAGGVQHVHTEANRFWISCD